MSPKGLSLNTILHAVPLPQWRRVEWVGCPECSVGGRGVYGPHGGYGSGGDPLVCLDCGEVGEVRMGKGWTSAWWTDVLGDRVLSAAALGAVRRSILGGDR